jgi:hypothetical protein
LPLLNELQIRVYLAAESQIIGWGFWKSKIAKLSCVSRRTITKGATEVHAIKEVWLITEIYGCVDLSVTEWLKSIFYE